LLRGLSEALRSRSSRLWKVARWLLLAISLVSVVLVLSPDLVSLRHVSGLTNAGDSIDPLPNDTSDPIAVAPGVTSEFATVHEFGMLEPAAVPGDNVLHPSGSGEPRLESEAGLTAADALDCVIDPYQIIAVGSAVTGIIEAVHVERSDGVKAGEVLVELDSGVENAAVELAQARAGMEGDIEAGTASAGPGQGGAQAPQHPQSRRRRGDRALDVAG